MAFLANGKGEVNASSSSSFFSALVVQFTARPSLVARKEEEGLLVKFHAKVFFYFELESSVLMQLLANMQPSGISLSVFLKFFKEFCRQLSCPSGELKKVAGERGGVLSIYGQQLGRTFPTEVKRDVRRTILGHRHLKF